MRNRRRRRGSLADSEVTPQPSHAQLSRRSSSDPSRCDFGLAPFLHHWSRDWVKVLVIFGTSVTVRAPAYPEIELG